MTSSWFENKHTPIAQSWLSNLADGNVWAASRMQLTRSW